ncbi:eCIS core domain-containing protein [Streptomyces gossypiisoli]|uniref:eCIS core domain-containing protein n=1 Tax=Streptomyces gossypiisoli TaxID=2748864 RepID=UPI0015DA5182
MSNSHTQDARADQSAEARRRKRKEQAAKSRTPEPKNIVSGAGQPLDPGVRRDLEERLGHDLGRVRLHTGRDAGQLTELLGADAVAVGQDVFFREGTFKPGTDEGRRLLAHELLHTVQNPHGLGALRAGREPGAVSLPQQPIEREAESAAQDVVRDREAPEIEQGQATPGWLRYATVDADRSRSEAIDPATLLDRLTNSVVRSLRSDPEDLSQRTRKQLARLPEELLDGVLMRLERRLLGSEHDRVLDFVDEIEAYDDFADDGLERDAHEAPALEPDLAGQVRAEREREDRDARERRAEEREPEVAARPEKEQVPEEGAAPGGEGRTGAPGAEGAASGSSAGSRAPESSSSSSTGASGEKEASGSQAGQEESGQAGQETGGQAGQEQSGKEKETGGQEATERQETPAASEEESSAQNRPGAAEAAVAGRQVKPQDKRGQQQPTGSPTVSGKDTQLPGAFSTLDGRRNQDLEGQEEETDGDPFGSGSQSEVEVGVEEPSAWDTKLQPEDFLPKEDLDVSGVPTADELDPSSSQSPSLPSFPAPPPTRADQVQAEREAEDAEDAAAEAEPEEGAGAAEDAGSSAAETEGGPESGSAPGGLAVQQAAAPPAVPTTGARDPKSGDDPKVGPVAAQTTVQEAPNRAESTSEGGGAAKESAAKEEKGTAAAGDKAPAAPEKESQQAPGGQSAQSDTAAQESAGGGSGGTGSGGTGAGGAGAGTAGSAPAQEPRTEPEPRTAPEPRTEPYTRTEPETRGEPESGSRTQAPAPTPKSAPSSPPPTPAPESAAAPKSAPETAPAPETASSAGTPRGGGGGGGGGGGATGGPGAAPAARGKGKKDSAPAPDLSGVAPEAGLATAAKLKPHKALQAMGGVGGAVDRSVGDEHRTLAAAPPSMERPAGAPQTLQGKPKADAPAQYSQDPAQQAQEPDRENAEVTGAKEPEGQIEAEKAEEPSGWDTFKMALGFGIGKVASWLGFEVDAQELAAKFAGLPTKDEALKQAQAGNAPGVQMQGAADQKAGEQSGHVDAKGQETLSTARDDSGRGMGEDQVYPNAPKEQLTAQVPGGQGGGGEGVGATGAGGAVPPEAASEVAEHERGPQFQAAFADGQKGISEGRQTKDRDFRGAQAKHKQQVDAEIAANSQTQAGEREKAMGEVTARREDWRTQQDEELRSLGDKKTERHDKVRKDVEDQEKQTDDNVEKEKEGSDKKIKDEGEKAEREAEQKKDASVQESGNWITKAFEWIKQKVIEIKNAIVRVIRAARDAVVGFIRTFKQTVERWINEARKSIVDAIKKFITDLIEFAKAMVRAVIELAGRIRKFITDLIAAAIALVNRLAQALKQAITDLLNAIGKLLSSILDFLKKALLAAVEAVVAAVKAIMDFAAGLLSALGDFMLIAVDFLSDPGGWLSGAKNSAVDGAKNHLFREVKAAVKDWFQSKIEEILGIPRAILDKLIKGGITLEKIVKETWDAIVPQLPLIIGEIVITKVIAKLIPGAGWVMAVIDAIRTAIGALGEILRAFGAVLDWLKAVRSGGAGILFAKAIAAGIVALLELAYEALLSGIGKYVAKVGRRLKGVAERLGRDKNDPKKTPTADPGTPTDQKTTPRGDQQQPAPGTSTPRPTATTPRPGTQPRPTTDRPKPTGPTAGRPPAGPGRRDDSGRTADRSRPTGRGTQDDGRRPQPGSPAARPTAPVPTRPRAESPQRPTPDRDTPTRPKDAAATPTRTGDDRDTTRPGNDAGATDRNRPGPDPARPQGDRDPNRPRGDQDPRPGDRPRSDRDTRRPEDRPGRARNRDEERRRPTSGPSSKGPKGRRPDRTKDPLKERQEKKQKQDRRRKEEDSKESKELRLQQIIARIRPKLYRLMSVGVPRRVLNPVLTGMRKWYRLTALLLDGADRGRLMAELNPRGMVLPFHSHDSLIEASDVTRARDDARRLEAAEARKLRDRMSGADRTGRSDGASGRTPDQASDRTADQESEQTSDRTPDRAEGTTLPEPPKALSPELRSILAAPLPGRGKRRGRRAGPVSKGESLTFRKAKQREVAGDKLTPDHIPSGAALILAAQRKAIAREEKARNRKLSDQEIIDLLKTEEFITVTPQGAIKRGPKAEKVYREALTLMVTGKEHEYRKADPEGGSRTHGSRNTDQQILLDSRDLAKSTEDDFRFYLAGWDKKNTLVKSQVYSMILHYKRLTDREEIEYSNRIDDLLLYYWEKARNDTD